MMVKDEEKNIARCLESIKTLANRDDVELIIVDTGSKDKTIEILKNYTDKVYFHKWNNNFSDMRNKSIGYAKGKWIFILDADEEVINTDKIVKVITSNEYLKYNTITITVENVLFKSNNDKNTVSESFRIFKNSKEFRYEGVVHNQPKWKHPVTSSGAKIIHYGYINDDEELMEKKFVRTSNLLINQLEKNPNDIYYRMKFSLNSI